MRKISILSLIAVLAATPMMAEAARTVTKENYTGPAQANTNVASTSYVQGAYRAASNRIDALIDDTAVAAAESGTYVAVSASSTVGENLEALDSKVKSLESATSANLSEAIDALDSTVSYADSGIDITVAETDGKLTSVSASIINSAVTTDKIADDAVTSAKIADDAVTSAAIAQSAVTTSEIADGTILVEDMNASAVVTSTEGIASDIDDASDSALVTEKAVKAAIDTINSAADSLDSKVGALNSLTGDAKDASTIVDAINAVDDAMNNKRLTVYTTWNEDTRQEIALSAATSAAQSGGSQEQPGGE